jgi:hypothetical protein
MNEDFEFPDEIEDKKAAKAAVEGDKFEVEIEDDTPVGDRNRKPMKEPIEDPTEDELASYDEKVQARIKKFTRGYHDERRAKEEAVRERTAAETFAKQVFEENKRLQQQLSTGSKAYIETSKNAAEIELQAAKKKYKEAYESGDADALTEANAEITQAALRLERASVMKPIEVEEREYQAPVAKVEHPRTQRWIEANSDWWGKDEEMTAAAMGLDRRLQREYGADFIGSKEYFDTIDRTMRKRFPEQFETAQSDEPDEDSPPRRATKPSAVVAPATRSTPPNRIKLKASEAAIARRLGVPLELYAKQVAQLKRGE